jgi:hypothetical protein
VRFFDLVGYVQTPLGAALAIAAVAVFYFWAVDLRGLWSAKRLAESAPRLEFIHLRRAALFNPPVTIFLIRMKS